MMKKKYPIDKTKYSRVVKHLNIKFERQSPLLIRCFCCNYEKSFPLYFNKSIKKGAHVFQLITISVSVSFPGEENLATNYKQDSKLSFVIKAIYTLAHGLHNMRNDVCGKNYVGLCEKLLPFNGSLYKVIVKYIITPCRLRAA